MAPEDTKAAMDRLAELARLSESVVKGTASFYDFLNEEAKAREVHGDEKYIVCYANEGDPGAFSDRYLLEQHPHKVMACIFCGYRRPEMDWG